VTTLNTQNRRIVLKFGSSSLTSPEGGLDRGKIEYFAREIAQLHARGEEQIIVSSGAVAAGFRLIGYKARPKQINEKQASAAVGQALLMQAYNEAFGRYGIRVAQILLTRSDFSNRKRIQNAWMTMQELLRHRIVPIINENDTVSIDELKFGDNDTLSALVANLVKARLLVIVTDTDGIYTDDPRRNPNAVRLDTVEEIDDYIWSIAGGAGTSVGTGGMRTKIEAARIATRGGIPVFIGSAKEPGDIVQAVDGSGLGTYFKTHGESLSMKRQWIGFHSEVRGTIYVDDGAASALLQAGKSLLAAGVVGLSGEFHPGDVVEVATKDGKKIGRGIVNYASWQLQAVQGLSTEDVMHRVEVSRPEVIHRDEWVALTDH
jgi:glutamate 5-kinase